jgi:hypothetical protein
MRSNHIALRLNQRNRGEENTETKQTKSKKFFHSIPFDQCSCPKHRRFGATIFPMENYPCLRAEAGVLV